jgi:hypothetical protein
MMVFNLMCSFGVRFKSKRQIKHRVSVGEVSGQLFPVKKVQAANVVHHPYFLMCTLKRAVEMVLRGS